CIICVICGSLFHYLNSPKNFALHGFCEIPLSAECCLCHHTKIERLVSLQSHFLLGCYYEPRKFYLQKTADASLIEQSALLNNFEGYGFGFQFTFVFCPNIWHAFWLIPNWYRTMIPNSNTI